MSAEQLERSYRKFRDAFASRYPRVDVVYSYKTNPLPGVLRELHGYGAGAEVISHFELWLALQLGVPPPRIVFNGPAKTLLSKATQSSGSVEALLEEFPDAKFITIVRHPYESVASHVSVFYPVWRAHSPDIAKDGPVSKAYARLAVKWFRPLSLFRRQE